MITTYPIEPEDNAPAGVLLIDQPQALTEEQLTQVRANLQWLFDTDSGAFEFGTEQGPKLLFPTDKPEP